MNVRLFYDFQEKSTKVELLEEIYTRQNVYSKTVLSLTGVVFPGFFGECFHLWMVDICGSYIKHDFIYKTGLSSRKDADIFLRKNLERNGMNFLGRWAVYFSVRLFGSRHYNKFEKI